MHGTKLQKHNKVVLFQCFSTRVPWDLRILPVASNASTALPLDCKKLSCIRNCLGLVHWNVDLMFNERTSWSLWSWHSSVNKWIRSHGLAYLALCNNTNRSSHEVTWAIKIVAKGSTSKKRLKNTATHHLCTVSFGYEKPHQSTHNNTEYHGLLKIVTRSS